jgi:vitamin B12 transporter
VPSISNAAKRRRYCLLASSVLFPAVFACMSQASAQQSASPNLLPPVTVTMPAPQPRVIHPAEAKKPRRIARARVPKPSAATAPAPGPWPAGPVAPLVVSPTGIVGPIGQTASSVSVITAQDIQTQQYRTVPEAIGTVPGLNVVPTGRPGRADLGLHSRHQFQPHQGVDRRHQCRRSQHTQRHLRFRSSLDRRHRTNRSSARSPGRTLWL